MSARWLLVVSYVTVAACSATEPEPYDLPLRAALEDRSVPEIALPDLPTTSLGRCAVELGPRPPETSPRILAELVARNGAGWQATDASFDPLSGVLQSLARPGSGTSDRAPHSDDDARAIALAFFATNYDLFGLSAVDLSAITISVGPGNATAGRSVEIFANWSPPPDAAERYWSASLTFAHDGPLRFIAVQSQDLLPDIQLCDQPALRPDDASVRAAVVGYPLSYRGLDGSLIDVGEVEELNVFSTSLITHRTWSDERDRVVLRRAYTVGVVRASLTWSFIVDAETGERLAIIPRFST